MRTERLIHLSASLLQCPFPAGFMEWDASVPELHWKMFAVEREVDIEVKITGFPHYQDESRRASTDS